MFFKAFSSIGGSHLPLSLTFIVEYQASQVLACGDINDLKRTIDMQTLPDSLFWEVEFFGTIPREMREEVRVYFQAHERTLYETARQVIDEPDNEELYNEILRALHTEDEMRANILHLIQTLAVLQKQLEKKLQIL
jgi:hypothetical protein